jgi:hypothetical protein
MRAEVLVQAMNTLPHDLSNLGEDGLEDARTTRDERLTPLLRRWPVLSHPEITELKRLYEERMRLAKHVGKLRRRRHTQVTSI